MNLVETLNQQYMKPELPTMNVGDTVRVTVRVKEGNRERTQAFEGTIIAKKHGGINETITVRRISYNVGCEKVFPVHSPSIVSVETVRRGKVRRAKLYYLRDRVARTPRSRRESDTQKKGRRPLFLPACRKRPAAFSGKGDVRETPVNFPKFTGDFPAAALCAPPWGTLGRQKGFFPTRMSPEKILN